MLAVDYFLKGLIMETRFKVIGTYGKVTIPWAILIPHESQAIANHGQTLQRLNERGGLCWSELLAVLKDKKLSDKEIKDISEEEARKQVELIVSNSTGTITMILDNDGCSSVPLECCTMTNPLTTPSGKSEIDDVNLPCGEGCERDCGDCIIQKIMNEYAELTHQTTREG